MPLKDAPWKQRLRDSPRRRSYSQAGAKDLRQEPKNGDKIEEETLDFYNPSNFYPAYIGQVLAYRYRIVGKLGYGSSSTVWLARDLETLSSSSRTPTTSSSSYGTPKYVVLKIFTRNLTGAGTGAGAGAHEAKIYEHINKTESDHPGRKYVRTCIDSFETEGPDGGSKHQCLVHPPLWKSIWSLLRSGREPRLPEALLKTVLGCLLRALDHLHSECHLVHTDIKAGNIMLGLDNEPVLEAVEQDELADPSPRNIYPDRTIYQSRTIDTPKAAGIGFPVLCDFGLTRFEGGSRNDDGQPAIYRAPEIILGMDWSYSVDIWNIGAMIFDLFYARYLFDAHDPAAHKLSNAYHLSEMAAYLGPLPLDFLERSEKSCKYFDRSGRLLTGFDHLLTDKLSFEALEDRLEGGNRQRFLDFVRSMLQWDPDDRLTARELIFHPWLSS